MRSGVYKITNKVNGKFYIGSSYDVDNRWMCHRRDLNAGTHPNPKLQNAWTKYGKDNFIFEVIEEVQANQDLLFERENHYLSTLKPYERNIGFNICPDAKGGDNITHNPNRDKFIEKMLVINKGEGNGMYGKNHSEKSILEQKNKAVGRYTLDWFIEKYGEEGNKKFETRRQMLMNRKINYITDPNASSMSFKGHKHKAGFKEKSNQSKLYFKEHWNEFVELIKSGKYSQRQLSNNLGISRQTLRQRIKEIDV